jgi:hypothetical protein
MERRAHDFVEERMSRATNTPEFEAALDRYFSLFDPTIQLLESLMGRREHSQEIVLLACARLDALASGAVRDGSPAGRAFKSFVRAYGRRRELMSSVSVADLYYELRYHNWLAEGLIPVPGRVTRFGPINDSALYLLRESELPVTAESAERLFSTLANTLRAEFRVMPRQSKTKASLASPTAVITALKKRSGWLGRASWLEVGLQPLLESCTVESLLYRNYRNEAVHGIQVAMDESKFYREAEPYWRSLHSEFYGSFLILGLPGRFLLALLQACLRGYREHLRARQKLPPDVHNAAVGSDWGAHLSWLDSDLLTEAKTLSFKVPER